MAKLLIVSCCICLGWLAPTRQCEATYVLFTTDVCWTCGDDFQGAWKGKNYGVPLIVESLEERGFKGTFFVSPYCPAHLEPRMYENLRFLVSRGHDLELHTHPDVFDLSRPRLNTYTREERRKIFRVGVENIMREGAPRPIAHRAGCLSIDAMTLRLLPEFGMFIDSSIYPRYGDCNVKLPENWQNRFFKTEGCYELAPTLIQMIPYVGDAGTTILQLDSTIWEQQEAVLNEMAAKNQPFICIMLHFFSLYRSVTPSESFTPLRVIGPNNENIRELNNLLDMVGSDKRFRVVTVREFWDIFQRDPKALDKPGFVHYTGLRITYLKCLRYFFEGRVGNKIVVLSPFVLLGVGVLLVIVIVRTARRGRRPDKL